VRNDYDLQLTQGAAVKTVDVDCKAATATADQLAKLTVKAPQNTYVEIRSGGKVTSGTVPSSRQLDLYVVKNTYDLYLRQGAGEKTVAGVNVTADKTEDQLCKLTVKAPHNTQVKVLVDGGTGVVTSGTVPSSKQLDLYVVRNDYDLQLTQGTAVKTVDVDCKAATATADQLAKLTVKAPQNTYVEVRGSGKVTSGTVPSSRELDLYVVKNTYDLYLKQGAGAKTVAGVNVTADKTEDQLCKLTVKAPHNTQVKVLVDGSTTDVVTSGTVPSSKQLDLYVVRNDYDVTDGSATKDVDCKGATATVIFP